MIIVRMSLYIALAAAATVALLAFQAPRIPTESEEIAFTTLEQEKWHEFESPNGHFRVSLPTLPQHAMQNSEDPRTKEKRLYDMYISEQGDGTIFMINLITTNETKENREQKLTKVVDDLMNSSPHSKLKNLKKTQYKENPSMEFSIANEQADLDGKVFLVGNTLYVLTMASKPSSYNRDHFEFFINSFNLQSEGEKK